LLDVDVLLVDVPDPELDGATELALEEPVLNGEDDEELELGIALLLAALCAVVAEEPAFAFEAPDEHPGSTIRTHRPAIASGLRRAPSERGGVHERPEVTLMRICGTLPPAPAVALIDRFGSEIRRGLPPPNDNHTVNYGSPRNVDACPRIPPFALKGASTKGEAKRRGEGMGKAENPPYAEIYAHRGIHRSTNCAATAGTQKGSAQARFAHAGRGGAQETAERAVSSSLLRQARYFTAASPAWEWVGGQGLRAPVGRR
jgi:hypothetical protein